MYIQIDSKYYQYVKSQRKLTYQAIANRILIQYGIKWSRQQIYELMAGRNQNFKSHKVLCEALGLNINSFYKVVY